MRENQLKYVDAEGMRVITNSKHVAEQIKIDKGENIVMDREKFGKVGKIDGQQNLKSTVMNGVRSEKESMVKNLVMDEVKFGKVGKLENCRIEKEMLSQSEERLCRSITKRPRETQP